MKHAYGLGTGYQARLLAALALAVSLAASADDCLPLLVPNITYLNYDSYETLAFLKVIDEQKFSEIKKNHSFGFDIPVDGVPLGAHDKYSEFLKRRESYFSKISFNFTASQSLQYLAAYVPDSARTNYLECVQRKPFSLAIQSRQNNIIIFQLRYKPDISGTPDKLKVRWESSEKGLADALNRDSYKTFILRNGEVPVQFVSFDKTVDFSLVASAADIGQSASVLIPAEPKLAPRPAVSAWQDKKYSIPLKIRTHVAKVGNVCTTVNVSSEVDNDIGTDCPIDFNGWSYLPGRAHIQEFDIDFDRKAALAIGLPFKLTSDQLSFKYKCSYYPGAMVIIPRNYGWVKVGETCGNENGEPLLSRFWMELTGTLAKDFHLEYSCIVGGHTAGPFQPGADCASGGGIITGIKVEIDSIPKQLIAP